MMNHDVKIETKNENGQQIVVKQSEEGRFLEDVVRYGVQHGTLLQDMREELSLQLANLTVEEIQEQGGNPNSTEVAMLGAESMANLVSLGLEIAAKKDPMLGAQLLKSQPLERFKDEAMGQIKNLEVELERFVEFSVILITPTGRDDQFVMDQISGISVLPIEINVFSGKGHISSMDAIQNCIKRGICDFQRMSELESAYSQIKKLQEIALASRKLPWGKIIFENGFSVSKKMLSRQEKMELLEMQVFVLDFLREINFDSLINTLGMTLACGRTISPYVTAPWIQKHYKTVLQTDFIENVQEKLPLHLARIGLAKKEREILEPYINQSLNYFYESAQELQNKKNASSWSELLHIQQEKRGEQKILNIEEEIPKMFLKKPPVPIEKLYEEVYGSGLSEKIKEKIIIKSLKDIKPRQDVKQLIHILYQISDIFPLFENSKRGERVFSAIPLYCFSKDFLKELKETQNEFGMCDFFVRKIMRDGVKLPLARKMDYRDMLWLLRIAHSTPKAETLLFKGCEPAEHAAEEIIDSDEIEMEKNKTMLFEWIFVYYNYGSDCNKHFGPYFYSLFLKETESLSQMEMYFSEEMAHLLSSKDYLNIFSLLRVIKTKKPSQRCQIIDILKEGVDTSTPVWKKFLKETFPHGGYRE